MKDKCLVLLIESLSYCKENNQNRIKRSDLLRLCNNRLKELSEGDRPKFGGSFEECLKKYSDASIIPNQRLFTVDRSKTRHNTQIYPNFDLIEKQLRARRILNICTNPNTITKTIHPSLYENPGLLATVSVRVRRADSKSFLEEVKNEFCAFLKSNPMEICISTQENGRPDLYLSEHTIKQLESLLEQIALDNKMTREYFSLTLEYPGIPTSLIALERYGKHNIFYQKLCLYFEQWLKDYHGNTINEEERTMLRKGDLESLSMDAREKLRSFLSSIEDYCDSSLDADQPLLQITAELNRACL